MSKKRISRNAPCPCGSGKKYKNCCYGKGFEWVEDEDGAVGKLTRRFFGGTPNERANPTPT